ncbi:MAG: hypothetical protein U0R44_05270 [Candidatus Micrarchaeia archaeon]
MSMQLQTGISASISAARRVPPPPLIERNLTDRLAGKRILFVFCDHHHDESAKLLKEMAEHGFIPGNFETARWSGLIEGLSGLKADVLLIFSIPPESVVWDHNDFRRGLTAFKANNPSSGVVMMSLYSKISPPGILIESLSADGLVDKVAPGPATYNALMQSGAEVLERASA